MRGAYTYMQHKQQQQQQNADCMLYVALPFGLSPCCTLVKRLRPLFAKGFFIYSKYFAYPFFVVSFVIFWCCCCLYFWYFDCLLIKNANKGVASLGRYQNWFTVAVQWAVHSGQWIAGRKYYLHTEY